MQVSDALVGGGERRFGRLANRPALVNPAAERGGLSGALRRTRLKEWVGFTLLHPDVYSSMIVQDAKYLASSEIYVYHRSGRVLYQHAATGRAGHQGMTPELYPSYPHFETKKYLLEYEFARQASDHTIRIEIHPNSQVPAFRGELTLYGNKASHPLAVSTRVPGGAIFTHKAAFPAEGTLRVGDLTVVFDPERDLVILDEHRSFLPYRTRWTWGTFFLRVDGGLAGANFAVRRTTPGFEEESCIWSPAGVEPLGDISFEPLADALTDPGTPWRIRSADGRLDVTFEPEGRKTVKHQLVLAAVDYFQMFGRYRGTLRTAHETYEFVGIHGVCEKFKARL